MREPTTELVRIQYQFWDYEPWWEVNVLATTIPSPRAVT